MKPKEYYSVLMRAVVLVLFLARAGYAADAATSPAGTNDSGRVGGKGRTELERKALFTAPSSTATPNLLSRATGTEMKPEEQEPLFVRSLVPVEAGRNDSNPVWSPKGTFLAFERSAGDKREIRIVLADGTPIQTIYTLLSDARREMKFFFPGVSDETSYNAGLTWSPDEFRFVFMSNGGEGNYDIYLQDLGGAGAARLTDHKEKDGQANWAPEGSGVVFVSGRTGNGDVYLLDLASRALTRLTRGGSAYLYPRWSPDGSRIVMMHGSNENHHIVMITDITMPVESRKTLTAWVYDDLRPLWSPDGKKIAFYSNYNASGDSKLWSIIVVAADGSDPAEGDGLAAKVVATDVLPDVEMGPAWMPDSNRIVFVKNDRQEYNPLYVADLSRKTVMPVKSETRMNHDVSISPDGTIAFRAQVDQWDQIFIMRLKK